KEVLRTFRKESDVLIHVFVNGEEIETTAVHPFWVENRWVSAKDLKEGDLLTLADGSAARISGVYGEKLDEAVVVYNFEVEEFHTYYVTDTGVLVHNANQVGGCGVTGNKSDSKTTEAIKGTSYDINKMKRTQPYTYPEGVQIYKDKIIMGGANSIEPIPVRVHHGEVLIVDGHHRYEAFKQLGYKRVPIKYLHKSNLGKSLPDGNYYRTLEQLLSDKIN
ncbi:polymorphic toxin-type HINT domain-containing protein, partial [Thomasclavelia cocleata]|uniref:polymorphic toxin-type HINT domain-containing protein n=2 Tax=Thomasclavelia cocleata TaxID=69824 RepID=UPI0025ABFBB5